MKNFVKKIAVAALAFTTLTGAVACGNVKNGSKLQTMTVTFDVDGTEKTVDFELYLNLAPGTIDHVKYLVGENYYNDTVVSNVNGHVEFGEYYLNDGEYVSKYGEGATLSYDSVIKSYATDDKTVGNTVKRYNDGYTVSGEFERNGIKGNTLSLSDGALVLKRNIAKESSDDDAMFDTAKATLAVTFGSDGYYYSADKFAIIGKVKDSDALTEIKKFIADDFKKDDNGNTYYYYDYENCTAEENKADLEKLGHYFMKDDEGNYYYKSGSEYRIMGDDYEDIISEFSSNSKFMRILPVKTITVKSIKLGK